MNERAHVFVVDRFSYPVHANKGFCGVKNPKGGGRLGLIADIKAYRKGDLVFFYHRRVDEAPLKRGFRDIFRIISEPFYDNSTVEYNSNKVLGKCPVCHYPYSERQPESNWKPPKPFICSSDARCKIPCGHHILPYRVLIEPIMRFEIPLDDNTAYIDPKDKGELPTLRWRKVTGAGRARSAQHILPEEIEKLRRLLKEVNNDKKSDAKTENYISVEEAERKKLPPTLEIKRDTSRELLFNVNRKGAFYSESALEAWILENIDKEAPVLKDVVGPIEQLEYFGNGVQYGIGGEKTDVLLLHKKNGKRFKATVIELKKDKIDENTVDQLLNPKKQNYAKWIGLLVTSNVEPPVNSINIQPVMIGSRIESSAEMRIKELEKSFSMFSKNITIDYKHRKRDNVEVKILHPVLISYKVEDGVLNLFLNGNSQSTLKEIR